jgi:hypothetical protein
MCCNKYCYDCLVIHIDDEHGPSKSCIICSKHANYKDIRSEEYYCKVHDVVYTEYIDDKSYYLAIAKVFEFWHYMTDNMIVRATKYLS